MERPKPPSFVLELKRQVEHGTEEEAVAAQKRLLAIAQAAGAKGRQVQKEKREEAKARAEAVEKFNKELREAELLARSIEANEHLLEEGVLDAHSEEFVRPLRPE